MIKSGKPMIKNMKKRCVCSKRKNKKYYDHGQRKMSFLTFSIKCAVDRQRKTGDADEKRHFPKIVTTPVVNMHHVSEEIRHEKSNYIFGGKKRSLQHINTIWHRAYFLWRNRCRLKSVRLITVELPIHMIARLMITLVR